MSATRATTIVAGAAQISCRLGDVEANTETCAAALREGAAQGAQLLILPECSLSGYMINSAEQARGAAVRLGGPELSRLSEVCRELDLHAVVGCLIEEGGQLFNACALLSPSGMLGVYRKAHLPCLGVDRFVAPGDGLGTVYATEVGRIGLAICYDVRFPEISRAAALNGADIVVYPSNVPATATLTIDQFLAVRAAENRVFVVLSNRYDSEEGVQFRGRSRIVSPMGEDLGLGGLEAEIVTAELDLGAARDKASVVEPGVHEVHLFEDRRPELYGDLTAEVGTKHQ